jgi:DNA-binding response OmpR family regulator
MQEFNRSVAVLDDDVRFIRMVERVLNMEDIGVQPITTIDLDEAERVVAETGCFAALVDIMMYDNASGFDLVERLRRNPATQAMPLIITSGAKRELARRVDFLREHHCAVLLKPFAPEQLVAQVRAAAVPVVEDGTQEATRVIPFVPREATARP